MAKKKKLYFHQGTQDAIVEYLETDDPLIKSRLYIKEIGPAFNKLAENLIHSYGFYYYETTYEDLKHETVYHLIDKMDKYKEPSGKAFSFFNKTALNYLIAKNKNNYKKLKQSVELTVLDDRRDVLNEISYSEYQNDLLEFMEYFIKYMDTHANEIFHKKTEIQITDAILELFRRREYIELFNKKALYIMIREMVDVKTHEITNVVNVIQPHFETLFTEFKLVGYINIDNVREIEKKTEKK